MAQLITFLGGGSTDRTIVAIAAAKQQAIQGHRVLLATLDTSPAFGLTLGVTPTPEPMEIGANLQVVQLQAATLLERSWEEVKKLEAQYLRSPILKNVFGQELGVLPGMDSALALNAIREYNGSGKYDVIVFDGTGDQTLLKTLGMPETLSWYVRRFQKVFVESDLGKTILESPFIQPLVSTVLNVNWSGENLVKQPTGQVNNLLDEGKAAVSDPNRVVAYLLSSEDKKAIAQAKYLWGSAQQINLTVAGVILTSETTEELQSEFSPLSVSKMPPLTGNDWQPLIEAIPDFKLATQAPKPLSVDVPSRQVRLFLPGFDKKQVKLTQNGPEVTIEAGDQRRNLALPPALSGQPVKGAKFQDSYLIISF